MAQQNGIEKPDLHALPTISDRMTFIYLEHCKVSRENGAVTATDLDGTVYIPAAAITVLLLGPGTLFPAYAGLHNFQKKRCFESTAFFKIYS